MRKDSSVEATKFLKYLAMGDSMSIDSYPAMDAEAKGISDRQNLGAASLLFNNDNSLFSEFQNRDLRTWFQGIEYENLAADGATCEDVLSLLSKGAASSAPGLITLTLGGNDLLQAFRRSQRLDDSSLAAELNKLFTQYSQVIEILKKLFPKSLLILTTVYDPSDGTGILPTNFSPFSDKYPIEFLDQFNAHLRKVATSHEACIADVHQHFRGHGAFCGSEDQFWFWKPSPIEPSCEGASEIRRVWLDVIQAELGLRNE